MILTLGTLRIKIVRVEPSPTEAERMLRQERLRRELERERHKLRLMDNSLLTRL